ncbi:hypothetical protein DBP19_36165 [Streptomyces sp. CS090A]|uniref:DUF6221 family protein n=1 Tax=Streptomyces sp. CS090A TaxID=2162710 RepID=UPI000D51B33F|nr:DUF6221 family protein [Streptomyces sp. CS090A]PVC80575.1 hypothetical protein DBP19_36165 [Streptomyces sp. CS090A]
MNHPTTPARAEDVLAYLDRAITTTEEAARAADATDPAPWGAATSTRMTIDHDPDAGSGLVLNAAEEPLWDCEESNMLCMTAAASVHAALHDPKAVLRRCAADRKLIALHHNDGIECPVCAGEPWVDEDSEGNGEWTRSSLNAPCPTIVALAEGYGWTEAAQ